MRLFDVPEAHDDKYTRKMDIPQYTPSANSPQLYECFSLSKYNVLLSAINKSAISEEEKEFLKLAATRHIVFNYDKIADYYAHANAQTQKLMEQSALVIIDFDDAIANGYVQFSKNVKNIMEDTGRKTYEN